MSSLEEMIQESRKSVELYQESFFKLQRMHAETPKTWRNRYRREVLEDKMRDEGMFLFLEIRHLQSIESILLRQKIQAGKLEHGVL